MPRTDKSFAFVIPLYNEQDMIPILVSELEAFRRTHPDVIEVIFVNDGSKDQTLRLVREHTQGKPGYRVIDFSRNFGHQIAVTAGLDFVRADAAIIMDADLQDPLDVAAQMMDRCREGIDVVYGIRRKRDGEGWFKKMSASLFYRVLRWLTDFDIPMNTGDFRLVSKPVIEAYQQITEQQPYVRGLITWLGFTQVGIEYDRVSRRAGETKYPLDKMIRLAVNAIISFSDKPLRLATQLGAWVSLLAVVGMIWVLYTRIVLDVWVAGWASTLLITLFLGGAQMLLIGMIGAYVARIYGEVRRRPRYILREIWESV